jgi:hypothetical protein
LVCNGDDSCQNSPELYPWRKSSKEESRVQDVSRRTTWNLVASEDCST